MISSVSGSSSFNVFSIGNVRSYAASLTKSVLSGNSDLSSLTGSSSSVFSFLNSYQNTTSSALSSTAKFASTNVSNLNSLKTASSALSSAARTLGTSKSMLTSSKSDVVSSDSSFYSVANLSYDVDVLGLAKQHKLASKGLASTESTTLAAGKQNLSIQTEKGTFKVSFDVKEGDTNADVLKAAASAINGSKAGVTASVVTDDGKSTLSIEANDTGAKSEFAISGQAAEAMGIDVATQGKDASYLVNGKSYTSASNTVSLPEGRGATMTLQKTGSAKLTKSVDTAGLVKAAQTFAAAYNKTVSHLTSGSADGAGVQKALSLVADNRMTQLSIGHYGGAAASRLSAMGISIDEDGMMQIDAEKLAAAATQSPASVKSMLTGYGSVTELTSKNVETALRIPTATYTDFSKMQVKNSLIEMLMPKSGVLFDFGL